MTCVRQAQTAQEEASSCITLTFCRHRRGVASNAQHAGTHLEVNVDPFFVLKLLTEPTARSFPGETALPGGRFDEPVDETPEDTAVRLLLQGASSPIY